MRAISRRLGRLEDSFGVVETEFTRQLAARIEEGRRRVAEWSAREGYAEPNREDISGLTLEEILLRGCQRARLAQRDSADGSRNIHSFLDPASSKTT